LLHITEGISDKLVFCIPAIGFRRDGLSARYSSSVLPAGRRSPVMFAEQRHCGGFDKLPDFAVERVVRLQHFDLVALILTLSICRRYENGHTVRVIPFTPFVDPHAFDPAPVSLSII
jgi:hypothetical protein